MRAAVRNLCWGLLGQLALLGCGPRTDTAGAAPSAKQGSSGAKPAAKPPTFTFAAPQAWRSKRDGVAPIAAPDLARETWRALVNQNAPIQAKTPHWQALPAGETVELQMPPESRFRCVVSPLEVTTQANILGTELKAWLFARRVLCSSDDWRTWTESTHRVRERIGAGREAGEDAGLLLREQQPDGRVRETYVLLRSDPEKREATLGPPHVLPGVEVDED